MSIARTPILLLVSSLERGGAERQVIHLANGLDRGRFDVHVCSLSNNNPLAESLRSDVTLHILQKRGKYDASLIFRAARLMRNMRAAIVHSFLFDAEIVGRLAGRWARVPAIICSNRCPHLTHGRFKLWVKRITAGCFDAMVANSWAGREFECAQGLSKNRVIVIPNGVDVEAFQPRDALGTRRELGVGPETPLIGMVAHFRGNKNHAMLIRAAAQVVSRHPDARFALAGRPDDPRPDSLYNDARRLVAQRQLGDRVQFLGERSDVAALYNAFDINVLASKFEGTANVLLEAMACGAATIATDVGDNARVLIDNETGYVIANDDANALADRLLRLIEDSELRRRFGAAGRARAVGEFSIAAMVRKSAEVYLGVLQAKGVAGGAVRDTVVAAD
ncbi:MAG: glycosyltransferase [Phycisphaerales bacterium]|nr:glycosyltransferase [Phycisphaerales bacterium]